MGLELSNLDPKKANKGCRRCGDMIGANEPHLRGAVGYEYLCKDCSEALGLVDDE